MLTMARWKVIYWLSDKKNYYTGMESWVKRAFIAGSYALGDEGDHWRNAAVKSMDKFEVIVRDWAAARVTNSDWRIPV